jgi:uncharacterized protein YgiM (DUF1202 family)
MKVKRIEIAASILTLSLTVVMSGCSVSINLNNKKKEATESMETTEKKEETPAPESVEPSVSVSAEKTQQTQQTDVQDQYTTYYVVNCNESITLRKQPDVNSGQITQIPLGSAVSYISAASNGFYYISYNGNKGYSLASYLSPSSGGNSVYSTCRVVNCNESITLRPQPDVNSGEICQIPLGETVSYVGAAENGFYEICYMGKNGYALADYLTFVN